MDDWDYDDDYSDFDGPSTIETDRLYHDEWETKRERKWGILFWTLYHHDEVFAEGWAIRSKTAEADILSALHDLTRKVCGGE